MSNLFVCVAEREGEATHRPYPATPARPRVEEDWRMGMITEALKHCYVCDQQKPVDQFWRGRRLCIACQSAMHRRPESLFGVKVLSNPPPRLIGKCVIAACTMAAILGGLCLVHDVRFRVVEVIGVETPEEAIR